MRGTKNQQFTTRQGEYLSFIQQYTEVNRRPPAEADIASFFGVSPPSVHQMILGLERRGLLSRTPGKVRSIRVLVNPERLPPLYTRTKYEIPGKPRTEAEKFTSVEVAVAVATAVLDRQFEHVDQFPLDDSEFAPLVRCLVEGVVKGLKGFGVPEVAAGKAGERVLNYAVRSYTEWCAKNDPENADAVEDARIFQHLMVHGKWPKS
jgi:hypothetical protein